MPPYKQLVLHADNFSFASDSPRIAPDAPWINPMYSLLTVLGWQIHKLCSCPTFDVQIIMSNPSPPAAPIATNTKTSIAPSTQHHPTQHHRHSSLKLKKRTAINSGSPQILNFN